MMRFSASPIRMVSRWNWSRRTRRITERRGQAQTFQSTTRFADFFGITLSIVGEATGSLLVDQLGFARGPQLQNRSRFIGAVDSPGAIVDVVCNAGADVPGLWVLALSITSRSGRKTMRSRRRGCNN